MISTIYRERTAADLKNRIDHVLLNGQKTEIVELSIDGATVTVLTKREEDIKHIETVQIVDELGNVITEERLTWMSVKTEHLISDLLLRWCKHGIRRKNRLASA